MRGGKDSLVEDHRAALLAVADSKANSTEVRSPDMNFTAVIKQEAKRAAFLGASAGALSLGKHELWTETFWQSEIIESLLNARRTRGAAKELVHLIWCSFRALRFGGQRCR